MTSGGADTADAIRACVAQAESARRAAQSALSEAEDMLGRARLLGVAVAIEDVQRVVTSLERIDDRVGEVVAGLAQQLALVEGFSDGQGGPSRGRTSPGSLVPTVRLPTRGRGLTLPTNKPDPAAVPGGTPEVEPRADATKQVALEYQRRSGEQLAQAGFDIDYLERVENRPSPDFRITFRTFDCYTPEPGTSPESIRVTLRNKIRKRQADRFILNLDRNELSPEQVLAHLKRKASSRLAEVIAIKSGKIQWVWPQDRDV